MGRHDTTTELALAAGRGDRAALSEFIRRTQADVWMFLARSAGPEHADDLTQETFLRMLGSLPGFEGRSSALTWLLAIARRVAVDRYRWDLARPSFVLADRQVDGDGGGAGHDPAEAVQVMAMLNLLDDDRRDALILTQLMGFSYAECAEICGCPVGTIRSRVARARADLVIAYRLRDAAPGGRRLPTPSDRARF